MGIGAVAIGRNEGQRLVRCLKSLITNLPPGTPIVYVDSGSTDGSVTMAISLGVNVIELNMSRPFTMARGYNTGFNYICEHFPEVEYVQFIDGDCEMLCGWIEPARLTLSNNIEIAIVSGNLQERQPELSIYNRLAQMEWNTPLGEVNACVGIAMMRVNAILAVNGYNESLIAGEEPEMYFRLRQLGWKIWRIDVDMAVHDAAMFKFSQWWKRSMRTGWAFQEGMVMHGSHKERFCVRQAMSNWFWGIIVLSGALLMLWETSGLSLLLLLTYFLLFWRIYKYRITQGDIHEHARLYAFWCVLSKFPQAIGQLKYFWNQWRNQQATLIEYK
jgi:glycosyltransferase involved in cell wall biosynthesis